VKNLIDLTGMKFGRWTVVGIGEKLGKHYGWNCECECGEKRLVAGPSLRKGVSTSCGCRRKEVSASKARTHGMAKSRLSVVWSGMKARCANPNHEMFHRYGGRGIKVCDRWQAFANFHADMAATYKSGLSIDRIDNDGDYEPSNCRWATPTEQGINRSHPTIMTLKGEMTIREAAEISGVPLKTMRHRVWRGVPIERLLDPILKRPY
jgi:hypothetical protein